MQIMEIAKFILTIIGTFVGVSGLSFTILSAWMKKRQEELAAERDLNKNAWAALKASIDSERNERKEGARRLEERLDKLDSINTRLSSIEGELNSMRRVLGTIEQWFVNNTPGGK